MIRSKSKGRVHHQKGMSTSNVITRRSPTRLDMTLPALTNVNRKQSINFSKALSPTNNSSPKSINGKGSSL